MTETPADYFAMQRAWTAWCNSPAREDATEADRFYAGYRAALDAADPLRQPVSGGRVEASDNLNAWPLADCKERDVTGQSICEDGRCYYWNCAHWRHNGIHLTHRAVAATPPTHSDIARIAATTDAEAAFIATCAGQVMVAIRRAIKDPAERAACVRRIGAAMVEQINSPDWEKNNVRK